MQPYKLFLCYRSPEAWSRYHNQVHHYRVNEPGGDPDYFEKYTDTWKLNRSFMTLLSMLFFKWAFAAPKLGIAAARKLFVSFL